MVINTNMVNNTLVKYSAVWREDYGFVNFLYNSFMSSSKVSRVLNAISRCFLYMACHIKVLPEAATGAVLLEKVFLEISQNSQENTCARVSGLQLIKKETLARVFSSEFCEISKNTFFTKYLQTTACLLLKIM